jgi:hypothetical protein
MASAILTPATDYISLFHRRILVNARYWRDFVTDHADDVPALDSEREGIIKAITFGLDLAEAWPSVAELIVNFSPHLEHRGAWEGWNGLLEQAIAQAEKIGDLAVFACTRIGEFEEKERAIGK